MYCVIGEDWVKKWIVVFVCMFYHAEYYRIIVIAYDHECSQHHASFHVYVRMGSQPVPPPPPHTLTNEPMKKTYESQRDIKNILKNEEKQSEERFKKRKKKGEVIGLHATEVKKINNRKTPLLLPYTKEPLKKTYETETEK